jgi:hypothetical protein
MDHRHQYPTGPGPDAALVLLREDFPLYSIWWETTGGRVRYVAQRVHPGVRPHTVVSADPGELRAILAGQDP